MINLELKYLEYILYNEAVTSLDLYTSPHLRVASGHRRHQGDLPQIRRRPLPAAVQMPTFKHYFFSIFFNREKRVWAKKISPELQFRKLELV